jgi:FKBP-type peptidyl-prolyl cis-trans isomerase FkpA
MKIKTAPFQTYLVLIFSCFIALSCKKQDFCPADTTVAPESEVQALEAYLNSNSITAIKDDRGFYYRYRKEGSGRNPTICSSVTVAYNGRLTNGTQFDASNSASFGLRNLIRGWRQAIPLMKVGDGITLYLPPSLAYGSAGSPPTIPANAILIFDIDLLAIN